jgi:hypothetical protein
LGLHFGHGLPGDFQDHFTTGFACLAQFLRRPYLVKSHGDYMDGPNSGSVCSRLVDWLNGGHKDTASIHHWVKAC